jgi:all-trans-retinol 13,14-reductase
VDGGEAKTWDAIVVGAGLGGLTCAAYLAAGGLRVLVLEQYAAVGGNTHVFRRRGKYEFDVGLHYIGDCGPGGLVPTILAGIGSADRVKFLPMDPDGFDHITLPGLQIDVPTGWDRYRQRLIDALPSEAAGLTTFTEVCDAVGAEQRFVLLNADRTPRSELGACTVTLRAWSRQTLRALFDHCGLSARARTLLAAQSGNYGLAPDQVTVGMHTSVMDHYLRGAYYPEGGGQMISAALVEVIQAHGGVIRTRSRVTAIQVEAGRVTGVAVEGCGTQSAPVVVSNADYRRTVLDLVGPDHLAAPVVRRTEHAVMALPFHTLYVGLDVDLRERPSANVWWYADDDVEEYYRQVRSGALDEVPFVFVSFSSRKDPGHRGMCPPGHANMQIMTLCPSDREWWGVAGDPADDDSYRREPQYLARKEKLTEATLRAAETAIGPFREHITFLEAATPLTQQRFTLSTDGTPFGLAEWGGARRPETGTGITGLHVVGASTSYGSGVAGVMVGGAACAGGILGRFLPGEVYRGAVLGDADVLPRRSVGWDPLRVCRPRAAR